MANRWYNQFKGSLDRGVVVMYGSCLINTDGTVPAGLTGSTGITGAVITRTGTGSYLVSFVQPSGQADYFPEILDVQVSVQCPTTTTLGVKVSNLYTIGGAVANTLNQQVNAIGIQTVTASTGVAADNSVTGFTIHITIHAKNSVTPL